jgi:hypothetical protein
MKRGGPNHPKTYALAEALGIRRVQAIGMLELLFHFVAQYAPEGDVGRYSDKRIAAALDWCGSVSKLIDALVATRWLDRHPVVRLVLHDWDTHADRATLQKLSRSGKKPIQSLQADATNVCAQSERQVSQTNHCLTQSLYLLQDQCARRTHSQSPHTHRCVCVARSLPKTWTIIPSVIVSRTGGRGAAN